MQSSSRSKQLTVDDLLQDGKVMFCKPNCKCNVCDKFRRTVCSVQFNTEEMLKMRMEVVANKHVSAVHYVSNQVNIHLKSKFLL